MRTGLERWASVFAKQVRHYIDKQALPPLDQRLSELEGQVGQIMQRLDGSNTLHFEGKYTPGITYTRGAVTQHKDQLWFCKAETSIAPPGDRWQLLMHRPRWRDRDRDQPLHPEATDGTA